MRRDPMIQGGALASAALVGQLDLSVVQARLELAPPPGLEKEAPGTLLVRGEQERQTEQKDDAWDEQET